MCAAWAVLDHSLLVQLKGTRCLMHLMRPDHEPPRRLCRSSGMAFRIDCARPTVDSCPTRQLLSSAKMFYNARRAVEFSADSLNKFEDVALPPPTRCRSLHSRQNITLDLTLTRWHTSIDLNCLHNCTAQLFQAEWIRLECWTQSRQYHALFHQSITLGRHMSRLWSAG